jgi:hypothetical protein
MPRPFVCPKGQRVLRKDGKFWRRPTAFRHAARGSQNPGLTLEENLHSRANPNGVPSLRVVGGEWACPKARNPGGLGWAFRPCENLRISGLSLKLYRGCMSIISQLRDLQLSCFVMQRMASCALFRMNCRPVTKTCGRTSLEHLSSWLK